jgi:hypothetical protein
MNNEWVMICSTRRRCFSNSSSVHEALTQQGAPMTNFTRAKGSATANPSQLLNRMHRE